MTVVTLGFPSHYPTVGAVYFQHEWLHTCISWSVYSYWFPTHFCMHVTAWPWASESRMCAVTLVVIGSSPLFAGAYLYYYPPGRPVNRFGGGEIIPLTGSAAQYVISIIVLWNPPYNGYIGSRTLAYLPTIQLFA